MIIFKSLYRTCVTNAPPSEKIDQNPLGDLEKISEGVVGFRVNPLIPTTPREKNRQKPRWGTWNFFPRGGMGYTSTVK